MRILVVEDDLALQRIIAKRLREIGYIVETCSTGTDGLDYARSADFDAIVLDIMLPGVDGLSILRTLRAQSRQVGILLLTARDSIEDRVTGLDAGADDYLVKPFAFEELLARLRTLLRRSNTVTPAVLQVDDLALNTATHEVIRAGRPIQLTSKEYTLLEYMMYNAGNVLTRTQILDHVWGTEYGVESNVVDVYIRYLRNKIDKDAAVKLLQTVRGYGYALKPEEVVS